MSGDEGHAGHEHVGSMGEEAVRLMGALSGWFTHGGSDLGEGIDDLAGHVRGAASHAVHDLDEHLATGSAECRVCPVCRTVHLLREVTPEVRAHLADAATSLAQAAIGLAAAVAAEAGRGSGRAGAGSGSGAGSPSEGVQHIDLDLDPDPGSEPDVGGAGPEAGGDAGDER